MVGLDVARGVALLGMVSVHVTIESTGWWNGIASGRASVLFIALAGVVVSTMDRRGSTSTQPTYLRRRAASLVLVGLLMASTIWMSTILHYYGVLFLVAPFLLKRTTRCLAVMATVAIAIGPVVIVAIGPHTGWAFSLPTVSGWLATTAIDMTTGLYALVVWVGLFIAGIIVGRFDLTRRRHALNLMGAGISLAIAVTVISNALPWQPEPMVDTSSTTSSSEGLATGSSGGVAGLADSDGASGSLFTDDGKSFLVERSETGDWSTTGTLDEDAMLGGSVDLGDGSGWSSLNDLSAHSNRTPWALQSLGIALAAIGLFTALPQAVLRLLRPIATLGSMTLSAYVVHSFLVQDVWSWVGAADHPERQVPALLGIFAVLILGALAIRARWSQGPFEWLLKWISGRPTGRVATATPLSTIEPDMPRIQSLRTSP